MGAVVETRLLDYLRNTYPDIPFRYTMCTMWTDSTVVLSWIQGSVERWKPFVKHCVLEIQSQSVSENWRHCPGNSNPADLLTRGESAATLRDSSMWWKGPSWLVQDAVEWPKDLPTSDTHLELKSNEHCITKVYLQATSLEAMAILDVTKYSSLSRLLRVTAWVIRFVSNCRSENRERKKGHLKAADYAAAEQYWIRQVQNEAFEREVSLLTRDHQVEKSSPLADLHPFLDEHRILRVTGRSQELHAPSAVKHPIILPNDKHFTELIVLNAHNQLLHEGVTSTMTILRQRFWIPRARQLTKKIIHTCR